METIVSTATAPGRGAIIIIKISGDKAIEIAASVFLGADLKQVPSHTVSYGKICDGDEYIDEVLVSVFRAPKTYTREDVVEINCHGGMFVADKIIETIIARGARMATPGEFTKRAFLNGRIDLTQAEAVMDIVKAKTENSLRCANAALRGDVYRLIEGFENKLLGCIAAIETNIDYPEYNTEEEITNERLKPVLTDLKKELDDILAKAKIAGYIREGIKTAIIGRPNVGKSTMLNALLREDRAIVTGIPGTTRDLVEGKTNIGGILLDLVDTAGIRETNDEIERIGVERAKKISEEAELIILMLDNGRKFDKTDRDLLSMTEGKTRIVVINKTDLEKKNFYDGDALPISLLNPESIAEAIVKIEKEIKKVCMISDIGYIDAAYIGNARQIVKIKEAAGAIRDALLGIEKGYPIDLVNIDISDARRFLGELTGRAGSEELIDRIFSDFCLGK